MSQDTPSWQDDALSRTWANGAVQSAMVGRDAEVAALRTCVDEVSGGRGQVVVITGAAGIGKSRLAARIAYEGIARGLLIISSGADEVDQRRPFGVVFDAIRPIAGRERNDEIARAYRSGPGGVGTETRIADLLVDAVRDQCDTQPVVLILDDLQWADESSMMTLNTMARVPNERPLLLVCVMRHYPSGSLLRAFLASLDHRHAVRIDLDVLAPDEVSDMATGLAGFRPDQQVMSALEQAGGNPLYVAELLSWILRGAGNGLGSDGAPATRLPALPTSLRLTILEQLRSLPEATLELLRGAAVHGRSFSLSDLSMTTPTSVVDLASALRPAIAAGIVEDEETSLAFRHALIRDAIYEDISPAVRRELHRDLATRLAEAGAELDRVAVHLMLGAAPGDLQAIDWLRRAAQEISTSSPPIAGEFLTMALELTGPTSPLRLSILAELVRPLLWTGQAARAEEVCEEAFRLHPEGDAQPLFWLGLVTSRTLQGRIDDALGTIVEAAGCAFLAESDRLYLRSSEALLRAYRGDQRGFELAQEIVASAPTSISKGTAQEVIGQWELFTGHADRALKAFEQVESMRSPEVLENRIWRSSGIRVRMWEAAALLDLDRLEDAVRLLDEEVAAKLAVPGLPHALLAACRYHAGDFDGAVHECDTALARAEAAGSLVPAAAGALAATVALRRGALDEAERLLAEAERVRTPAEGGGDTIARWTRMLLLEATGRVDEAGQAATAALDAYLRAGFVSYLAWHAPDVVRVCLAAGLEEEAARAVLLAEHAAEQLPVASRRAGALRARGLLTGDPEMLARAVDACRETVRPIDLALALRDAAVVRAAGGDVTGAKPMAREATTILRELGASLDERVALRLFRSVGLTFGARTRRSREVSGWGSLTESERSVVVLAVDGLTNPAIAKTLYLSPRTVSWHLSNVYRKVGVASRAELAREVLRGDDRLSRRDDGSSP